VHLSAPFVQDQFRRPTVAVGHKSDLRVKGLKKIFANDRRKYLTLLAIDLGEQMIAFPDNAYRDRTHVVTSEVTVVQLRIDGDLFVIAGSSPNTASRSRDANSEAPGTATNAAALSKLIDAAYSDIKARVESG
jgi:hypothetical protein